MGLFGTSTIEASQAAFASPEALSQASIGNPLLGLSNLSSNPATGILGGASVGSLLGGVAGGFGLGSLVGGITQSALGKTGPSAKIGAGVGAAAGAAIGSIIPGVGTLIGGPIGNAIGGFGEFE